MSANNIKLIVTDLDNTLLRSDKTISAYTVEVFRRARERGILFAFATARSYKNSQEYRIALKPNGDIVTGGCLVYANGKLLCTYYLPEPQGTNLLAELCEYSLIKRVSARSIDAAYANKPIAGRIFVDFKSPLSDKLIHCSCNTDDGEFMKSIAARYPEFSFLHISGSDLYDINPKDATKFNGVKKLSEHFNIHLSEVIAFGDDFNDIETLRECGAGVAMSNAIDECKAAANYICGGCDDDGVAKWIEEKIL